MKNSKISVLLLSCCLFISCARDPVAGIDEVEEHKEIRLSSLGQKSLFGVIVNEYTIEFDLCDAPVDSVEVTVIEAGNEYLYGSVKLHDNRGTIENLKVPDYVELLYFDFMNEAGIEIRQRTAVDLNSM